MIITCSTLLPQNLPGTGQPQHKAKASSPMASGLSVGGRAKALSEQIKLRD